MTRTFFSILAVFTLVTATATYAQSTYFVANDRSEDPLRAPLGASSGGFVIADHDGDGTEDLFFGDFEQATLNLVRGRGLEGAFDWPRTIAEFEDEPFGLPHPTFIDVNNDVDLDIVHQRSFLDGGHYIEQTAQQSFVRLYGSDNPLSEIFGNLYVIAAEAADLNDDGLIDLVVGVEDPTSPTPWLSSLRYVQQVEPGTFIVREGNEDPFASLIFPNESAPIPSLADVDGDNDLDVVVSCNWVTHLGCPDEEARYFEQTVPFVFTERTESDNPFAVLEFHSIMDLSLKDFDADGDIDVLQSHHDLNSGGFNYYERVAPTVFLHRTDPYALSNGFTFETGDDYSTPSFGDIDDDGDEDFVLGENGRIAHLRRTDSPTEPFEAGNNPFSFIQSVVGPSLGDLDGDSDIDLIAVSDDEAHSIRVFEQTETLTFTERVGSANPFDDVLMAGPSAFGDVDGDGDHDLVMADWTASSNRDRFRFFEQTLPMAFVEHTGTSNPFDSFRTDVCSNTAQGDAYPILADLDRDGDIDLINDKCFYQHIDNSFYRVSDVNNPLLDVALSDLAPWGKIRAVVDLDGDNILDVVQEPGGNSYVAYFRTYAGTGIPVSSEPGPNELPDQDQLSVPVPNPVSGITRLTLSVQRSQKVSVVLYDQLGRRLFNLYDGFATADRQLELSIEGALLPAGVYIIRARGETFVAIRQLTIVH